MPSLVILVWAAAGRWVSARALTARPSALNDFDIAVSSSWPVLSEGWALQSFAIFKLLRLFRRLCSSHLALDIHGLDLDGIALVHEIALQLHGRRQLLV